MIIPVRCFTCGALIADKWEKYVNEVKKGVHPREVLDKLGIKRYCCRRMFLSHVELIDKVLLFYKARVKR